MKLRTVISILLVSSFAMASTASFAGNGNGGGGGGGGAMDRSGQMDRDRGFDRDRMQDRDRAEMRGEQKGDQTRDRQRIQDPANAENQEIYGNALMDDAERKQYRKQLRYAGTDEGRQQYQQQHEHEMQKRALQQGVDLVPPGQGPLHGGELMSVQERNQFREQVRTAGSQEERDALMAQHRERIKQRANALNVDVEGAE